MLTSCVVLALGITVSVVSAMKPTYRTHHLKAPTKSFLQSSNLPASWIANAANFPHHMTMTAYVDMDTAKDHGTLGAFVGEEVRGVQNAPSMPPFGPYQGRMIYQMLIYGDAGGESIRFKFKSSNGDVTPLVETMLFKVDDNIGNITDPYTFTPIPPSTSISTSSISSSNTSTNSAITSTNSTSTNITSNNSAVTNTSNNSDITSSNSAITSNNSTNITSNNSVITSSNSTITSTDTNSRIISTSANAAANWGAVNAAHFSSSMSVSAIVSSDVAPRAGTLGAFAGDELRGVQHAPSTPPFGPYKGKMIYQITIYGDSNGDRISFKFKLADGTVTPLAESVIFKVNDNIGSITDPYAFTSASFSLR